MQTHVFTIPGRFHPPSSLLGRWIRRRSADARQAESIYIVAAVLGLLGVVFAHIFAWSIVGAPSISGVVVEAGVVLVVASVAFAGFATSIRVRFERSAMRIADHFILPYAEIDTVRRIDADIFHRHYRRYAATLSFVNRIPPKLLLIRTIDGTPVVLGLPSRDLDAAEQLLARRTHAASSHVDAA